jgi:hypothetical protein
MELYSIYHIICYEISNVVQAKKEEKKSKMDILIRYTCTNLQPISTKAKQKYKKKENIFP